jgi:hypothetical protein
MKNWQNFAYLLSLVHYINFVHSIGFKQREHSSWQKATSLVSYGKRIFKNYFETIEIFRKIVKISPISKPSTLHNFVHSIGFKQREHSSWQKSNFTRELREKNFQELFCNYRNFQKNCQNFAYLLSLVHYIKFVPSILFKQREHSSWQKSSFTNELR